MAAGKMEKGSDRAGNVTVAEGNGMGPDKGTRDAV